jgi:hypothetical protein
MFHFAKKGFWTWPLVPTIAVTVSLIPEEENKQMIYID